MSKADSYENEKLKLKWPKSVFLEGTKNMASQSYGNGFVLACFRQHV